MNLVCPPSGLFVLLRATQAIEDMDPANHEDPVFLFDFARYGRREATLAR